MYPGEERTLLPPFYGETMKTRTTVRHSFLVLLAFLLTAFFAVHAWGEGGKVGVVDMIKVIDQSKQGKKAMDEMTAKLKTAKSDLEKRGTELLALKGQIEKNAMTLSAGGAGTKRTAVPGQAPGLSAQA